MLKNSAERNWREKRDRMQAEDIVQEARRSLSGLPSSHVLQSLTYLEGSPTETEERYDPHAELRALVLKELQKTLSLTDRVLIRFLLEQEMACRQNEDETDIDSIHLCGFLLFLLGQLEDVELLWQAKRTTFDTWCGFDIQFLVGAGVSPTLAYLHSIQKEWAEEARTYIEECQRAGDFSDLESYRHEKQRYFCTESPLEESSTTEYPKPQ
jgi:hypothetical protein